MQTRSNVSRRRFLKAATCATASLALSTHASGSSEDNSSPSQQVPLKIGIRAASMRMVGDVNVIRTAANVPELSGVELQVHSGKMNLRDWDVVRHYKRESDRWSVRIQSLAGVWERGVKIHSPNAGQCLLTSIRAAEILGSTTILLAFFRTDAPDMANEESYGPIVTMLRATAKHAVNAGVTLGLENSLSPADNKKLVDLVDNPAVGVYYDLHNMAHYGHGDQAIPGIALLGTKRICMVHVKNGKDLLEQPGPIDWAAAFRQFNQIQYDGWFVYESAHDSTADCLKDTRNNNAFLKTHVRMPQV